jgi:hypothetical protein
MPTFPKLSTGAVAQYPLSRGTSYGVETVRFLDGSQQRCLTRGKKLRRWLIALQQLSESELQQVEQFFDAALGNFSLFYFIDPVTGESVPNCRLSAATLKTQYVAEGSGATALWIEETNG